MAGNDRDEIPRITKRTGLDVNKIFVVYIVEGLVSI